MSKRIYRVFPDPSMEADSDYSASVEIDDSSGTRTWICLQIADCCMTDTPHIVDIIQEHLLTLDAVAYLRRHLNLSNTDVADLVDISRNTIRNWQHGQDAYPATVRRLFQIANLIQAAETALGPNAFISWLDETQDGTTRRDLLKNEDGPRVLGADIASLIFPRPRSRVPDATDLLNDEEPLESSHFAPEIYQARPRRIPTDHQG